MACARFVRLVHRSKSGSSVAALLPLMMAATVAGCGPAPTWTTVTGPHPAALYSVWGPNADDVWAVGGCTCPGKPHALLLHKTNGTFTEVASPVDATLWWVHGFSASDVWIAGEQGTVLHWDGAALTKAPTEGLADTKLFGIWGPSPSDLWAVGGSPDISSMVLRWNGTTFAKVANAPEVKTDKLAGTWFKVWGSGPNDVWLVGQLGMVANWNGSMWKVHDLSALGVTARDSLFTVAGRGPDDVYVVGGQPAQGLALHYAGGAWKKVAGLSLDGVQLLTGVSVSAAGDAIITGMNSARFVGREGSFRDDTRLGRVADWHAAYLLGPEQIFVAGGDFNAQAKGVIGYYGK